MVIVIVVLVTYTTSHRVRLSHPPSAQTGNRHTTYVVLTQHPSTLPKYLPFLTPQAFTFSRSLSGAIWPRCCGANAQSSNPSHQASRQGLRKEGRIRISTLPFSSLASNSHALPHHILHLLHFILVSWCQSDNVQRLQVGWELPHWPGSYGRPLRSDTIVIGKIRHSAVPDIPNTSWPHWYSKITRSTTWTISITIIKLESIDSSYYKTLGHGTFVVLVSDCCGFLILTEHNKLRAHGNKGSSSVSVFYP